MKNNKNQDNKNINLVNIYLEVLINHDYKKVAYQKASKAIAHDAQLDDRYCYVWAAIEGYKDCAARIVC